MGDAADDAFDRGLNELEEGMLYGEGSPGEVKCKHCGAFPLTWLHTGVRWRLTDERNRFHVCAGKPATVDDFE